MSKAGLPRTKSASIDAWIKSSFESTEKPQIAKERSSSWKSTKSAASKTSRIRKTNAAVAGNGESQKRKRAESDCEIVLESSAEGNNTQSSSGLVKTEPLSCASASDDVQILSNNSISKRNTRSSSVLDRNKQNSGQRIKKLSFVDLYAPTDRSDLAVNPKKVREVFEWMRDHCAGHSGLLVLSGPSGSGKTATVRAIANELDIQILEWTNERLCRLHSNDQNQDFEELGFDSQISSFREFLRGADYGGACVGQHSRARIVLVEEMPNAFIRDPSVLHGILENYAKLHKNPLVFIVSDVSASRDLNMINYNLFPPHIVANFGISQIAFNAVAATFLVKALRRVVDLQKKNPFGAKQKLNQKLKAIAETADGDIRSAMFNLELCLSGDQSFLSNKSATTPICLGSSQQDGLDIFHALGKILYAKREELPDSDRNALMETDDLPAHLRRLSRPSTLSSDMEQVVSRCHLSADRLLGFLHENEPDFSRDIEVLNRVFSDFSSLDSLTKSWEVKNTLSERYIGLIGAKSVAFWNYDRHGPKTHGFAQFRKPKSAQINRDVESKSRQCVLAFEGQMRDWPTNQLMTEFIPFLDLIGHPADILQQKALQMCNPNRRRNFNTGLYVGVRSEGQTFVGNAEEEQSDVEIDSFSDEN